MQGGRQSKQADINSFVHDTGWKDLPRTIRSQAVRCLLDTLGAGISGHGTKLSTIIRDFAVSAYGGKGAFLWLDGREVSPPGAAFANGMTVDAIDIHDGHPLTKGHAGAAVVPAVFAAACLKKDRCPSGKAFLTDLAVGYEIALRAGIALHSTVCDYHTSGAWNALGCAALTARRLGLNAKQTRHALGIAEYNGPRSQMMRCIDHPAMLKDGSGWGAMTGVSSAMMAENGFTGAPALTVESEEAQDAWLDLGTEWRMAGQYFKPHAVCRWAQPAVEGAALLQKRHDIRPEHIRRIRIETFHQAVRLDRRRVSNTEEAQYNLPFPVAALLVFGKLGASELTGNSLEDPQVMRLMDCMEITEDKEFNQSFPARRFARVCIDTGEEKTYDSGQIEARWDAGDLPSDEELLEKFRNLAKEQLAEDRIKRLEAAILGCEDLADVGPLLSLMAEPRDSAPGT